MPDDAPPPPSTTLPMFDDAASDEAPERELSRQAIALDETDIGKETGQREEKSAPALHARFEIALRFPFPVVGKVDLGQEPVRGIERTVEQGDAARDRHLRRLGQGFAPMEAGRRPISGYFW